MSKEEKIILILGIVIIFLIFLNIIKFINKNKDYLGKLLNSKIEYDAIVIDKRHYNEKKRNLFYVKFSYDNKEEEFLVNEYVYNSVFINQNGKLTLKYEYFYDFK